MLSRRFTLLSLSMLVLLSFDAGVFAQDGNPRGREGSPALGRKEIIENHERRKAQLKELLERTTQKVEDHDSGRNLLETEEYESTTKRLGLYKMKLEKMDGPLEERDIEKLLHREQMRAERNRSEL